MKRNESVSRIMSQELSTVHSSQKLSDVRKLLAENDFHHVPIVDGAIFKGIISSSDILKAGFGTNEDEIDTTLDFTTNLSEIMQKNPVTISPSSSVRDAAEILSNSNFHCIPVVEENKLVGLVTSTDLIKYLLEQY